LAAKSGVRFRLIKPLMPDVPKSLKAPGPVDKAIGTAYREAKLIMVSHRNIERPTIPDVAARWPAFIPDYIPRESQRHSGSGKMDWKIVIDGIAKATLALLVVEVLVRLAMAFNVGITGVVYLDATFACMIVLTIAGYGVYYGRTLGAMPISLVATVILGISGFALALVALLGFPAVSSSTKTQLFWVGALLIASTIPLGSYASGRIRKKWHGYVADFDFGRHSYDLAKGFDGCADGKHGLSALEFAEPE